MKKTTLSFFILLSCLFSFTNCSKEEDQNSNLAVIGDQVWMNKNLDVTVFRNGDSIFYAKSRGEWASANSAGKPAYCYYEFNPNLGSYHGKIYNYSAMKDARGLAPIGFRIPSKDDFTLLRDYANTSIGDVYCLFSTIGWQGDCNGTNLTGFNAIPSGYYYFQNSYGYEFKHLNSTLGLWTTTPSHNVYMMSSLSVDGTFCENYFYVAKTLPEGNLFSNQGFYVRCLKITE